MYVHADQKWSIDIVHGSQLSQLQNINCTKIATTIREKPDVVCKKCKWFFLADNKENHKNCIELILLFRLALHLNCLLHQKDEKVERSCEGV